MFDRARAHTTKLTLEMLKDKKQFRLLEPHNWPPNIPDLIPVDFGIWGLLEQNVCWGQWITDLDSLKETIVEGWNKFRKKSLINVLTCN